jgi:hypothetical protein
MVNFSAHWVCRKDDVLAHRIRLCLAIAIANGLVGVGQAGAQELVDVAALEAQVEAAAELAELPAEPDWGVQDLSDSLPVVEPDAPEVPSAAVEAAEVAPAPQYHSERPQYHKEYQIPESNPVPPPIAAPVPAARDAERVEVPAAPVETQAPAVPAPYEPTPQTPSTPTIWIWVWNWTWVQGTDERYHNSDIQYQVGAQSIDQNLARIIERVGIQMPVQIDVQTDDDIVGEVVKNITGEGVGPPSMGEATPMPTTDYRKPAKLRTSAPAVKRPNPAPAAVERSAAAPTDAGSVTPQLLASARAVPVSRQANAGKSPRVRRATRPSPTLPRPAERFADSGTASSASVGIFLKSFAILIASLLLTASGRGRRLRLPSTRPLGLLGTRTDPFG